MLHSLCTRSALACSVSASLSVFSSGESATIVIAGRIVAGVSGRMGTCPTRIAPSHPTQNSVVSAPRKAYISRPVVDQGTVIRVPDRISAGPEMTLAIFGVQIDDSRLAHGKPARTRRTEVCRARFLRGTVREARPRSSTRSDSDKTQMCQRSSSSRGSSSKSRTSARTGWTAPFTGASGASSAVCSVAVAGECMTTTRIPAA